MTNRRSVIGFGCIGLIAAAGLTAAAWIQDSGAQDPPRQREEPDLVGGLKAVEGCLGVETARTSSGKNVIFAWFKDKPSVIRWYYSETHQGAMDLFVVSDEYAQRKPLEHVPDDAGPIMVVASITPAEQPHFDGLNMPISQIAIELYETLPGGAFLGTRFAPDGVNVAHLNDYTP